MKYKYYLNIVDQLFIALASGNRMYLHISPMLICVPWHICLIAEAMCYFAGFSFENVLQYRIAECINVVALFCY